MWTPEKQQLTVIRKTHVGLLDQRSVGFSTWQIQATEENHHQTLLDVGKKSASQTLHLFRYGIVKYHKCYW